MDFLKDVVLHISTYIRFPSVDHEQNWQPYLVDPYFFYMCDHTYIHKTVS